MFSIHIQFRKLILPGVIVTQQRPLVEDLLLTKEKLKKLKEVKYKYINIDCKCDLCLFVCVCAPVELPAVVRPAAV